MQPVFEIRRAMIAHGYTPIPVVGKKPPLEEWQKIATVSQETLEEWDRTWPCAGNTGVLTRLTPTLDLDLLNELAAIAAENLVRERFEARGRILSRIGCAPKRAIPFRTQAPFKKLITLFAVPAGVDPAKAERIEFLADGQQFVAHGVHPDTHKEYLWTGGDPTTVAYDDLPEISATEAEQLQNDVVAMLVRDFSYSSPRTIRRKTAVRRRGAPGPRARTQSVIRHGPRLHSMPSARRSRRRRPGIATHLSILVPGTSFKSCGAIRAFSMKRTCGSGCSRRPRLAGWWLRMVPTPPGEPLPAAPRGRERNRACGRWRCWSGRRARPRPPAAAWRPQARVSGRPMRGRARRRRRRLACGG
jgi:hypothetical protein